MARSSSPVGRCWGVQTEGFLCAPCGGGAVVGLGSRTSRDARGFALQLPPQQKGQ